MPSATHRSTTTASSAAVWQVLADFDRLSDWGPGIDHSSWMAASEPSVGAVRRVQVGRSVLLETITEWEPESALSYEISGLPPIVSEVVNRWSILPTDAGCEVELAVTVRPGPKPPMKPLAKVLTKRIAKTNAGLLEAAVARAEATMT